MEIRDTGLDELSFSSAGRKQTAKISYQRQRWPGK